jgi:Leucine-rich repeat (LRR) protein
MLSRLQLDPVHKARQSVLWLFFLLLGVARLAQAQCPAYDEKRSTYLTSQAEINAFPPGCTTFPGSLFIRPPAFETSDITDLSPLSGLQSVTSGLIISGNTNLTTLTGLSSLTSVGTLNISYNPVLTDLTSLSVLTQAQDLVLAENGQLSDLTGLENITQWKQPSTIIITKNPLLTSIAKLSANFPTDIYSLLIEQTPLTDLRGLERLKNSLYVVIKSNPLLTSVAGLSALTSTSQLQITDNAQLPNLTGLENMYTVANLLIDRNPALTSIASLTGVTQAGGDLSISNNDRLTNLTGLDRVTNVGGNLIIDSNPVLTNISSLSGVTQIGRDLQIVSNAQLTNLTGLNRLTSVGNNAIINSNPVLTSLAALSTLTQTGADLQILGNAQLPNLLGLSSLARVGNTLRIDNNAALTSLAALSALIQTGGDLAINNTPLLTNLTGLDGLTNIGKSLRIANNPVLTSIAGLSALTQTGADLQILNNARLTNLTGLEGINRVGGSLLISDNITLTSIASLSALTQAGGDLLIANNGQFTRLTGLNNLARLGGSLDIENNAALSSIDGLNTLTQLGGSLVLSNNPVLSSIAGLNALTRIGSERYIVIRNNTQLSQCAIAPVCQYLTNLPQYVSISGNAAGCSSPSDVQNKCGAPIAITTQPPSQSTVCVGGTVVATVATTSNALTYQWNKGSQPVPGQTTNTLTLTNVQPADAGAYWVVVTSQTSSVTSTAFTLTVTPASADYQPLVDLYNATGGANWTRKTNWLTGCIPCNWYGVSCDGNGRVTAINLIGNNLIGTLPASLSALTSLQSLELGANALTGGIPTGIGNLPALQTLNLSRTQLGGGIPASLGQLTRLQNLLLNESQLTGPLPASLGTLAQLQNLQLYTNQLSGCFPASYTALCGRASISFANNPDLPGGGDFGAFCTNGTGGELVVVQGPRSGTACSGSAFNFSVVARGAGSYQWYKFGPGPGEFQRLAESGPVLSFSAVTAADAGTYQVYINYGCRAGAVQSDLVTLTVPQPGTGGCAQANTAPVATANTSQTATVGRAFSYTVNAFTDAQTPTSLTYSASLNPANGLSFDATTRVLSGTPSQPEPVRVTITATDPGGLSASTSFSISVGPRVVSSAPLRVTLTASPQTVLTSGSTVLRATATGGTLGAPPNGYTYDFKGPGEFITSGSEQITVTNLPAGVQTFTVVVSDAGTPTRQTTSATVSVTVTDANTAPTLANAIASQSATVGQALRYVIPAGTFTDAQTPNSLSLSVAGLPQGVIFTAPATLSGTPSLSGVSRVTVTATDPGGLSVTTSFSVTVQLAPVVVTPLTLTLTASPTALLTTGTVSLSATVSGGTPAYRYTFSGPGTIVPSNNTAQVSNLPAGVQTFTVVVSDAATPMNQSISRTVSVTVSAPSTNTALRVLHLDADNNPTNNAIKPNLQLENTGTAPIAYGQLTLRYWLTVEQFSPLTNLSVYYAQLGTAKVTMKYVALDKPRQGAYGYVEYSFDGSAGSLAAGANSGLMQTGIAKQDYTPFNEADDYSYANTRSLTVNTRITAYLNGQLAWGVEPAEIASQRTVKAYTENKNGSSTNTISTFLQVRNEGNVAVNYSDLKVRYYFTSEGSQPLNVYLDYAVLGNQKIKGQFVRLNPPLANADAYLELSFDASLGTFNPGSSTGNIQYRIAKQDWSNFTQSNDYSYQNGTQSMTENSRVVVYLAGQRVYGTEPGAGARPGIAENDSPLRVTVLGNPVTGAEVSFDITGVEGQSLQMQLIDESGQLVSDRSVERAEALERQTLPIRKSKSGVLLLRVSTPGQSQTVKVLGTN